MSTPDMSTMNHPFKMATRLKQAVLALAAGLAAPLMHAQTVAPVLTPPAQRITDQAISADQATYEATQARLKALNANGRPLRDYHLAKAQCWLDVSFHEYTRNDRGPFPQDALAQADLLVRGLENAATTGQPALGQDTPLISGAQRLRPDLWASAQALKGHRGVRCAQHKIACAEVELVHAGHEQVQQQWRHAMPYVQIAEDLLGEARLLAERCDPPPPVVVAPVPVPVPVPPPPPPPPPPPAPVPVVQLMANVVFAFDRHTDKDMRSFSVAQLQTLVAQAKAEGLTVQKLVLVGHADRLNGTGQADYNQRLSEKRAATVRAALQGLGLPGLASAEVLVQAQGDGQPVQPCSGRFASNAELQECLLPNRRVDVRVIAVPARR